MSEASVLGAVSGGVLVSGFGAALFLDFNALDDHLCAAFARDEIRYLDVTAARPAPGGVQGRVRGLKAEALTPVDGGRANVSPDPLAGWAANQIAMPQPAPPWLHALVEGVLAEERAGDMATTLCTRAEEARVLAHFVLPLNARFSGRIPATECGFCVTASPLAGRMLYRDDLDPGFWLRVARRLHAGKARGPLVPAPA